MLSGLSSEVRRGRWRREERKEEGREREERREERRERRRRREIDGREEERMGEGCGVRVRGVEEGRGWRRGREEGGKEREEKRRGGEGGREERGREEGRRIWRKGSSALSSPTFSAMQQATVPTLSPRVGMTFAP